MKVTFQRLYSGGSQTDVTTYWGKSKPPKFASGISILLPTAMQHTPGCLLSILSVGAVLERGALLATLTVGILRRPWRNQTTIRKN
jgi:hypothetical protein